MTLTLRPITGPDELDLFNRLTYVLNDQLADDLANGRRRPEWLWMALRGDTVVARAAWWCRPGDERPVLMDIFDLDGDTADGVRLVRTALASLGVAPPEFCHYLAPDWRDHEETRRAAEQRMAALQETGAKLFVERLRMDWLPGTPIPAPSGRLTFRPPHDAEELIGLMTRVLDGTLDAYSRADLTTMTAAEAARTQYRDELEKFASPHDWWRVGVTAGGEPVGFVVPAHNGYNPCIAYIGVVPEHRGRGHVDDLLAAGTSVLAAQDVPRIRASTDLGNTPMAAAFARAGYQVFQRQIDMTWD